MIYNMSRYKLVYYVKTRIFGFSKIRKSSLVYNFKPCFHLVHLDQFRRLIAYIVAQLIAVLMVYDSYCLNFTEQVKNRIQEQTRLDFSKFFSKNRRYLTNSTFKQHVQQRILTAMSYWFFSYTTLYTLNQLFSKKTKKKE